MVSLSRNVKTRLVVRGILFLFLVPFVPFILISSSCAGPTGQGGLFMDASTVRVESRRNVMPRLRGRHRIARLANNEGALIDAAVHGESEALFIATARDRVRVTGEGVVAQAGPHPIALAQAVSREGALRWTRVFPREEAHAVVTGAPGETYVATAAFLETTDGEGSGAEFIYQQRAVVVRRVDGNGQTLWERRFGPVGSRMYGSLYLQAAAVSSGGVLLAFRYGPGLQIENVQLAHEHGIVAVSLGADGEQLWARRVPGSRVETLAQSSSGRLFVVGVMPGYHETEFGWRSEDQQPVTVRSTIDSGDQLFIAAFDGRGNPIWAHPVGGRMGYYRPALRVAENGDPLLVTVETGSDSSVEVHRFDSEGELRWQRSLHMAQGGTTQLDIAELSNSDLVVVASHKVGHSYRDYGGPVVIARYAADGQVLGARTLWRTDRERPGPVAVFASGEIMVSVKHSAEDESNPSSHAGAELGWYLLEGPRMNE